MRPYYKNFWNEGIKVNGQRINNLRYADDAVVMRES